MTLKIAMAVVMLVIAAVAIADVPLADPKAVADVKAGRRKSANAAWWGFDPVNATAALQGAINSGARKVIVPNVGHDWIIDPVFLASDQEIVFEKGVVLAARKGGFTGLNDCLLKADKRRNVTIRGYGATLVMQKPEYTKGEWRMCLELDSCSNVKVLGLTLRDSGGDGIYLGNSDPTQPYCKDIVIRDCVMDNNRRQGMSVITAVNLLVERCVFRSTSGTAPRAGVDLEPNEPGEKLVNCVFRNCVMEDNEGPGILIYMGQLTEATELVSIRFEKCRVRSAKGSGIEVGGTRRAAPPGTITFRDCVVENCRGPGLHIFQKSKDAARVRFERCTWRSVARRDPGTPPMLLTAWNRDTEPTLGGIDFADCDVADDRDRPFLAIQGGAGSNGVADVRGTLTVRNPHGARMSPDAATGGIALQVHKVR
jgi:polygalacturonase